MYAFVIGYHSGPKPTLARTTSSLAGMSYDANFYIPVPCQPIEQV